MPLVRSPTNGSAPTLYKTSCAAGDGALRPYSLGPQVHAAMDRGLEKLYHVAYACRGVPHAIDISESFAGNVSRVSLVLTSTPLKN